METPQSGTSQTPSSSGIGGATVPLTPTSHTSTTELPSLQTLLGEILVENIGKEQAFVDAALDSFKEEDVSNVSLLITLRTKIASRPLVKSPSPRPSQTICAHMMMLRMCILAQVGVTLYKIQSDLFCENWICFVKCWEH